MGVYICVYAAYFYYFLVNFILFSKNKIIAKAEIIIIHLRMGNIKLLNFKI